MLIIYSHFLDLFSFTLHHETIVYARFSPSLFSHSKSFHRLRIDDRARVLAIQWLRNVMLVVPRERFERFRGARKFAGMLHRV